VVGEKLGIRGSLVALTNTQNGLKEFPSKVKEGFHKVIWGLNSGGCGGGRPNPDDCRFAVVFVNFIGNYHRYLISWCVLSDGPIYPV